MDDADQLRQEVAALTQRLRVLESAVAKLSGARPEPAIPAIAARPRPRTGSFVSRISAGKNLESRIGSQLFNRIGIIALFAGVGWFFKFAVDNGWLGPLTRIVLGLVAGSGIVLWSERFRRRGYAGFSYTLKAVGAGVLYLTLWAAFSLYHFIPAGVAFAGMILVTLLNASLALLEDAELLAFYALSGGFSTPLLLSTGVDHEIFLFSYLLLLNIATFVLIARKPWTRLIGVAYPATVFYAFAWYFAHFTPEKFAITLFFAALFWILFAVAPTALQRMGAINPQHPLIPTIFPLLHAFIAFWIFWGICGSLDSDSILQARAATALALSGAYLLLTVFGIAAEKFAHYRATSAILTVVFLAIFIPLQWRHHTTAIIYAWLVEGLGLAVIARQRGLRLVDYLAALPLSLAFISLLGGFLNIDFQPVFVFNSRFICSIVAVGTLAAVALLHGEDGPSARSRELYSLCANLLALVAVSREIAIYWRGSPTVFAERFSYSIWFMLYGAGLLLAGFWRNSAFLRWQGLVVLAFTIAKVFLYDMATLSQGYRVLSLLGLGALLLSVSFAYQRDWLRLRENR
ncbi:MAG TPA: DUF2339 domain-containing protein [Candidatus Elarobacter sp.]|nr:DUF2339 domain-containing protein [Candidatus Elarobacter sp.]